MFTCRRKTRVAITQTDIPPKITNLASSFCFYVDANPKNGDKFRKKKKLTATRKKWNCVVWKVSLTIYCVPSRACLFITDKFTEKFPSVVLSYSLPSDYKPPVQCTLSFLRLKFKENNRWFLHEISLKVNKSCVSYRFGWACWAWSGVLQNCKIVNSV